VLPLRLGTFQCQPLQHVHPLSPDHQLHQVIHLRDQIRSRNVVHHPDLELVDPLHQLLLLLAIIDLHPLASLEEKTNR
jgi:hypothetical protein